MAQQTIKTKGAPPIGCAILLITNYSLLIKIKLFVWKTPSLSNLLIDNLTLDNI